MNTRRTFLRIGAAAAAAAAAGAARAADFDRARPEAAGSEDRDRTTAAGDYTPVVTPNGRTLPFRTVAGAKVFHLIAGPVDHEFAPGLRAACWGYNGAVHGPTIEAVEGDRVRIYVTNRLPAATSIHWHGFLLPNGMDGVAGLTQRAIRPGETFKYEFELRQHGTLMYHSHHDEAVQLALGLSGMFVVHPKAPAGPRPDRDFAVLLSEWRIAPGTSRPDPNEMTDFNVFTMNARVFPATDPLLVRTNERVRVRFANLSAMEHHPIHVHGHRFVVAGTEGGATPPEARRQESTVLVPVGSTRTIEFVADAPGDWAIHCHMTHHVMTQMGHGTPNLIGATADDLDERVRRLLPGYMTMGTAGAADMGEMGMPTPPNSLPMAGGRGPFEYITMGGMFTVMKVRDEAPGAADPGWYRHPQGAVAAPATAEELRADGVDPTAR